MPTGKIPLDETTAGKFGYGIGGGIGIVALIGVLFARYCQNQADNQKQADRMREEIKAAQDMLNKPIKLGSEQRVLEELSRPKSSNK
jgi:hypothetical protein